MSTQSDAERARAYRARKGAKPRGELKPCGTVAAARRHQRAGEPLCSQCVPVWAEHQRTMYRNRKAK